MILILVCVIYIYRPGVVDKYLLYASAIAGDSDAVSSLWMYAFRLGIVGSKLNCVEYVYQLGLPLLTATFTYT